jgi:PAS domain S-box-containing protein
MPNPSACSDDSPQREVLDGALDCVITIDELGLVNYFNESAQQTFGYRADEAIGRELAELIVPPDQREAHRSAVMRHVATGVATILGRRLTMTAMRSDGSEFPAELTVIRTDLPGGARFTGFVRDLTEQVRTEEELRAARRRLIAVSDAARARLTRDIHDGAQQQFVRGLVNLQLANEYWTADPERARQLGDAGVHEIEAGIETLRELAAGIHPAVLSDFGLAAALDALAAAAPLPVSLHVEDLPLEPALESSIYFFCSEALTNVVKHASARSASVRVTASGSELTIEVRDDGVGGARVSSGGSGLVGLGDRVGALDGTLELSSAAGGHGTTLVARIPLP